MRQLGSIVRLQIQRDPLKVGQKPRRQYDPTYILSVPALELSPGGVIGLASNGEQIVDVHNEHHRNSRNHDRTNSISVGFTFHYRTMRERFGPRVTDGVAGETMLVQTDQMISENEVAGGLIIVTASGETVDLVSVAVAEPCVEFTRYAMNLDHDTPSDRRVTEALQFLRAGMRGYYAMYAGDPVQLRVGDRVMLP